MAQPAEERKNFTNRGIVNTNSSQFEESEQRPSARGSFDDEKYTTAHLHQHPSADAGVFNEWEGAGRLLAA